MWGGVVVRRCRPFSAMETAALGPLSWEQDFMSGDGSDSGVAQASTRAAKPFTCVA
eukprot:COSAG01_NODE_62473_length_284_cov_1.108108_1_plen_55_part_01